MMLTWKHASLLFALLSTDVNAQVINEMPKLDQANVCEGQGTPDGKYSWKTHSPKITGCLCGSVIYSAFPPGNFSNPCFLETKKSEAEADAYSAKRKPSPVIKLLRISPPPLTDATATVAVFHPELIEAEERPSPTPEPDLSKLYVDPTLSPVIKTMAVQVAKSHRCPINFSDIPGLLALAQTKVDARDYGGVNVDDMVGKSAIQCGFNYVVNQWGETPVQFLSQNEFITNYLTDFTRNIRQTSGGDKNEGLWHQVMGDVDGRGESSYRDKEGEARNPDVAFVRLADQVLLMMVLNYGHIDFVGVVVTTQD